MSSAAAIKHEINKILYPKDKANGYQWAWQLYFKPRTPNPIKNDEKVYSEYAPIEKKGIFRPFRINSLEIIRDYELNAGDELRLSCVFPLGLWYKVMVPYMDYLECVIKKTPLKPNTTSTDRSQKTQVQTYLAIPLMDKANTPDANSFNRFSREALDNQGLVEIDFQLMDLSLEKIRTVTFGNIFRKVKNEDVIKSVLSREASKVKLDDGRPAISAIQMQPADNTEERSHTLITQGTRLIDVPHYVQKRCGGVYSFGLASYIQNKEWYIFAPYNTKNSSQNTKTLNIFKSEDATHDQAEYTWRKDGDRLCILATSNSVFRDDGSQKYKDTGNGIRFADARQYMDKLVETKDNKATAKRKQLNSEYLMQPERLCGEYNNNVRISARAINANTYLENSDMALAAGSWVSIEWRNCDVSLLYPGMPVRIQYTKDGKVCQLFGILLKLHCSIANVQPGLAASQIKQAATLQIFVVRKTNDQENKGTTR